MSTLFVMNIVDRCCGTLERTIVKNPTAGNEETVACGQIRHVVVDVCQGREEIQIHPFNGETKVNSAPGKSVSLLLGIHRWSLRLSVVLHDNLLDGVNAVSSVRQLVVLPGEHQDTDWH